MPRRRVLTDARVESLLALPVDEPLLVRHWTLNGADLAAIERRRGEHNQLGFALQLCAFRYPGETVQNLGGEQSGYTLAPWVPVSSAPPGRASTPQVLDGLTAL